MDSEQARILVIDDDEELTLLVEWILKTGSYDVIKAHSGVEGLAKAKSTKPDLIVLDIMMPDMNGYEVCECLKANPETADIAILMLSALGNVDLSAAPDDGFETKLEDRLHGYDVGAVEFLSKPVGMRELMKRVKFLLWAGGKGSMNDFLCVKDEEK